MQVVAPPKDLEIVAVWTKPLDHLVDLLGLLALSAALAENDVEASIEIGLVPNVTLDTDEARFLCVLEVKAVAFCDLAVYGLLNPGELVNQGVAISVHHLDGEAVLGVDDPDEEEAVFLQLVEPQ